jgi:hypothetical protein
MEVGLMKEGTLKLVAGTGLDPNKTGGFAID